ncbi:hypothetical protein [Photobacterium chitinilyticum]|uniref:Uncharacterized protein n=1 Tax=Photobacterium chitinilyticum TaxID=2485123 RepID=A0A444JIN3_9GAMM|nr:hypothetical protein [Photobacterium chitinilyticum]RWX52929.1 hypothetical protein EDI28_24655 [Photobacterium chitinilyticum]
MTFIEKAHRKVGFFLWEKIRGEFLDSNSRMKEPAVKGWQWWVMKQEDKQKKETSRMAGFVLDDELENNVIPSPARL